MSDDVAVKRGRFPLRAKFGLLLLGFVLTITAVIVMNWQTGQAIQAELKEAGTQEFPRYKLSSWLLMHFDRIAKNFDDAMANRERSKIRENDDERARLLAQMTELIDITPAYERDRIEQLRRDFMLSYAQSRKLAEAVIDSELPTDDVNVQFGPAIQRAAEGQKLVRDGLAAFEEDRRNALDNVLSQIIKTLKNQTTRDLLIGIVASVLLIFLAFEMARRIVVPITHLSRATADVAQGNFDHSVAAIPLLGRDEVADLARSFDEMTNGLRETTVSRDYVDSIIDSMADMLVVIDADENVQTVNRATLLLLGFTAEEVIGKPATTIFPGVESILQLAMRKTLSSALVKNAENVWVAKNGREIPVSLSASILFASNGQMRGYVCLAQDMTERKKAHEALRKANAELAEARDQALAANETQSQFLANMSHELRTPLNAIIGYSEMLQEDAQDLGEQDFVDDLRKIQSAGKHLLGLINDILDISKIEAGKMQLFLEDFEVTPVVREVVAMVQPLVDNNRNEMVLGVSESLGAIHADMTRVRQVLFNLLSNASKFTKEGKIFLDVQRERNNLGEWMLFRVRDTGIGMTPEQMSKLFQPFTQAEAGTTRKYGGTGLGLTISKYFCTRMSGDLTVESEYGVGTTFTARIPVNVVERKEETPKPVEGDATSIRSTARGTRFTVDPNAPVILVIDDDAHSRELLGRYLNKLLFRVEMASSGEEGLQIARRVHPAAITLDVMMPSMDGWRVLSELKGDLETAKIPVVMVSMLDNAAEGQKHGAADYIRKPVDFQQLAVTLQKHIVSGDAMVQ